VGTIGSVWGDQPPAGRTGTPPVYYEPDEALTPEGLPAELAELQLATAPGTAVRCSVDAGYLDGAPPLADLVAGAGFVVESARRARGRWVVEARRDRTLPDFVGGGMRILVCGLNPSVVSADAGFGYAGATNRFWPAALGCGLVTRPRDPLHALEVDGVGMTDLVKRATAAAAELAAAEYRTGAARVERLVSWLRPRAVLFVGLAGWRVAIDRRALPGWQPARFGGVPAYVMPSTSGLNARTSRADLEAHMAQAIGRLPG